MVNYCIVSGCGRNSKINKHLYFYSLPKKTDRQKQWLAAAGRNDLLEKISDVSEKHLTYRICSRHFSREHVINKNLCAYAVPSLNLPGCKDEDDSSEETIDHENIICDNCKNIIRGFRYKCITCSDYDLCATCEMLEIHSEHYMVRMPKPLKFKEVEPMIQTFRNFFNKPNYPIKESNEFDSDDEPITKYATKMDIKHYDSGIDLSEDVKFIIDREVERVLKVHYTEGDKKNKKKLRTRSELSMARKRLANANETNVASKKQKHNDAKKNLNEEHMELDNTPEVAFADVNEIEKQIIVKPESSGEFVQNTDGEPAPVMHMKLSDDLTELMIVMNDQKTTYKF